MENITITTKEDINNLEYEVTKSYLDGTKTVYKVWAWNEEEFEHMSFWTKNDWLNNFKTEENYKIIK